MPEVRIVTNNWFVVEFAGGPAAKSDMKYCDTRDLQEFRRWIKDYWRDQGENVSQVWQSDSKKQNPPFVT